MSVSRDEYDEKDDVFEHISEPVESVQHYVPGGLHPVYLGDTLKDGRYTILRKLGYGGYSTVWLAQDNSESGLFVALKMVRADIDCTKEVQMHDRLRASVDQHRGSSCVMLLKDHFRIAGPNGNHDCLAYEVLGPSIARIREDSKGRKTTAFLTLSCARRVVYQVLLGLDYMHSVGLVHGDLYASNVLFAVKDLSDEPIIKLRQPRDQVSADVKRISGPQQAGDPRHLTLDRPLNLFLLGDGNIKLSDLGNGFFEDSPPRKLETPAEIRSPELIFDHHVSKAQDCWAFGCLIYNVLTNCYPFDLAYIYDQDSRNDAHLIQLFSLLGPLPDKLKHRWPRYNVYFNEGQLRKFDVDDDAFSCPEFEGSAEKENDMLEKKAHETPSNVPHHPRKPQEFCDPKRYPSIVKIFERKIQKDQGTPESLAEFTALNPPLKERWLDKKHPDMELEEAELVLDLLQGLFAYDPNQRLSTKAILQHAWIQNYCALGESNQQAATVSLPRNKRKRSKSEENEREVETKDVV